MPGTTRTWFAALTVAVAIAVVSEAVAQGVVPPTAAPERRAAAPERRAAAPEVSPDEAAPVPRLELLGVVIQGDSRRALVREPALTEGRGRWVEVGGHLGNYTVVAIERDRVVLRNDGEPVAVRLAGSPAPQRAATSPVPTRADPPGAAAAGPPTGTPRAGIPARSPASVAEFLAWRTGASLEDIQTRIGSGQSWLAVAKEYGLEPNEALREYRAWRTGR